MRMLPASALALCLMLTGCASPIPRSPNIDAAEAACVDGDSPGIGQRDAGTRATVSIVGFDGVPTAGSGPFCVRPGAHRLTITLRHGDFTGTVQITAALEAFGKYRFEARLHEQAFELRWMDIGPALHFELARYTVPFRDQ
ncbi:MAG: hypothetical protein R3E83_14780 [Burkholderiaceae bacterium]